ncbi:putative protein [Arabidopsis thaliana]|nr:putative protein [Arabidopsis thaliana]CAB78854.1 putative protein [Arabidopsis thaliana]
MFSLSLIQPRLRISEIPVTQSYKSPTICYSSDSRTKREEQRHVRLPGFRLVSGKRASFDSGFSGFKGENVNQDDSSSFDSERVDYALLAEWLQSSNGMRLIKRIHAMALKLGDLVYARKVFDSMPEKNTVTWTAMIDGYLKYGLEDEAFALFEDYVKHGIRFTNERMFVCLLNLCSRRAEFELGRQVHGNMVKVGVGNLIVESSLVYFYAQCGELTSALRAFDMMEEKDVISWTAVISACSRKGHGIKAIGMFIGMLNHWFLPNEFTVCSILKACSEEKALRFGRQVHSLVVKRMIKTDVFVGTSLMDMYAKCGEISDCRKVFDGMSNRNTVTWTSIIAAHAREGFGEEAISLFRIMKRRHLIANNLTVELHAQIIKNSIEKNVYIGSTLVWLYCKCGESRDAFNVLQQLPSRDVVSWTAMISGCSSLGHESEALDFLKEMIQEGVEPNPFTYSSALKACANSESLLIGRSIHSIAKKNHALSNVFVGSALIHIMPEKNLVSWKAMIMGYARNGFCREALKLMYRMEAEGFEVDDYIFATILSTCGDIELDEAVESSATCYLETS